MRERLKAAKRAAGDVELETIAAVQVAERCISRGVEPTEAEVALLEQSIAAHRATLAAVRARWEARAAAALPAPVLRVVAGGGA